MRRLASLIEKFKTFRKKEAEPTLPKETILRQEAETVLSKETKIRRRRYSKEETETILGLVNEGLTSNEIAVRLNKTEAGIRNLRYRNRLIGRAKDETKALFRQRDELKKEVADLKQQSEALKVEIMLLKSKKAELLFESFLRR